MRLSFSLLIVVFVFSCQPKENTVTQSPVSGEVRTNIKYAKGFTVTYLENSKLVEVTKPYATASTGIKYLLVQNGSAVPKHDKNTKVITVPITRMVCTSTSHIPLLDYLDETNALVGFPTTDYISSEKMRNRIDEGFVEELGIDKSLNIERLALLKPDLVMGYTVSGDLGQFKKIEELNTPVVVNGEYLEEHPLGRAEWIKFMALFFNKEEMADSVFSEIEKGYLQPKALASDITIRPTVMSGVVYGDTWFLPGGKNYAAKLLKDAGCQYVWEDNDSNGFLQLSFETVYEKAHATDLWIGVASFKSLKEIEDADKRYTKFSAFQNRNVFTYDTRKGAKGGSEFLELGYLRPDLILKDLVKIAHPELLPEHTLFFHNQLK
ncbi:MAG: ABC transporter substrate-binding protein [Cyclobacteriaceae bacterium]|nr:ABC transporter substrate-binding protein [Cyclobacteriaceae bacterium]